MDMFNYLDKCNSYSTNVALSRLNAIFIQACIWNHCILLYIHLTYNYIATAFTQIAKFMGPTSVLSAPGDPHVGPMDLAISVAFKTETIIVLRTENTFTLCPFSVLRWHRCLKSGHVDFNEMFILRSKYQRWWWLGVAMNKGINCHGSIILLTEYSAFNNKIVPRHFYFFYINFLFYIPWKNILQHDLFYWVKT